MSNEAKQQKQPSEFEQLRSDVNQLRGLVADMAMLFLPPQLREKCACGLVSCRKLTCTPKQWKREDLLAGNTKATDFNLCDRCTLPDGWNVVSTLELAPAQRETVSLANNILAGVRR